MTKPVITLAPETRITEAARQMLQYHISGLPLTDPKGAVVGIITDDDLLYRVETGKSPRRRWLELLLGPARLAVGYARTRVRKHGEVMKRCR